MTKNENSGHFPMLTSSLDRNDRNPSLSRRDRHGTKLTDHADESDQYLPALTVGQEPGKHEIWKKRQRDLVEYYVPVTQFRPEYFEHPWLSPENRILACSFITGAYSQENRSHDNSA